MLRLLALHLALFALPSSSIEEAYAPSNGLILPLLRNALFFSHDRESDATTGVHRIRLSDKRPHQYIPRCYSFDSVEHDYVLTHSNFLPDPNLAKVGMCEDLEESKTLRRYLESLSAPSKCVAQSQLITDSPNYGLGSVINSWLKVRFDL